MNIIKSRYIHQRAIYTWCGIALVAVNPYQEQDVYGDQAVETYHSASHSVYLQLDPHIYAVTEDAYSKLDRNLRDQSIIVSGESGAGKTVSAKHAMRYLASIASSKAKLRIENRVLASNPIMEAIGNASTVRNDNSSRFGKYIQIFFDRHNRKILGGNMRTYLLEKSRVTKQQVGERNFHIFYQLLNYAHKNVNKMEHLKLLDPDDSNRLRKFNFLGGLEPVDSRDDLRRFNEALKTLNIDEKRVDVIYRVIAGILHGGNIEIMPLDPNDDQLGCTIDEGSFHFKACCEMIGLNPQEVKQRIVTKLLKTGAKEVIEQPLTKRVAEYGRDAMLKYIYECLFTWLVGLINVSLGGNSKDGLFLNQEQQETIIQPLLKSPSTKKSVLDQPLPGPQFIGVLDIYGFENFKTNSFEQFCINYANEVLQQQYNQHVFKLEQEEYIREGIDWTFIEYSDNQPVIDIIESKPIGVLNLLDEECRMPKGSDRTWCAKLYEHLLTKARSGSSSGGAAVFKKPKINYQSSFIICHYAEEVNYDVETFLEKNRDTIADEQSNLLRSSEVIRYIFDDPQLDTSSNHHSKNRPLRSNKSTTVGHQFRGSLTALIKTLNATEPHYIRCIKPNDDKKAFEFNEERAVQQLKACGVYETIRISNNGFPSRWLYKDFAKRYCVLIYGTPIFKELAMISFARAREQQRQLEQSNGEGTDADELGSDEADDEQKLQLQHPLEEKDLDENSNYTLSNGSKEARESTLRFMRQFSSADVKPICSAICQIAYEDTVYTHLRTKEEQDYIDKLFERHGNKAGAIYQFGRTKIFFRAGQVGYLERIRSQKLREYTLTIQRHVRGWLARRSFIKRREQFLEQLKREASMVSLQNQVNSLQTELEQVKEEKKDLDGEKISRIGSIYQLVVDMMYTSIQPLVIGAVLEYEALDPPEPFASLESRAMTPTDQPMEDLLKELDKFQDLIVKNHVPEDIAIQVYKQLFYFICAQSLNQLLIRRDLCQFRKAMQISFNLSCLVQWCRERYLIHWRAIVEQLDPITQATKLLQTRKSSEDIATIDEVCNKLRPSQIIKILNMYTSSYEEQITTDFIHELENYLNKSRLPGDNTLYLDSRLFSRYQELEDRSSEQLLCQNGITSL